MTSYKIVDKRTFVVGQTEKPKLDRCRESPIEDNQANQLNKELNYHTNVQTNPAYLRCTII